MQPSVDGDGGAAATTACLAGDRFAVRSVRAAVREVGASSAVALALLGEAYLGASATRRAKARYFPCGKLAR
jgi:hypothetical protein